jgi:hypothetical protein
MCLGWILLLENIVKNVILELGVKFGKIDPKDAVITGVHIIMLRKQI